MRYKRINEALARKLYMRGFNILVTNVSESPDEVATSPYNWHNKFEGNSFWNLSENLRVKLGTNKYKVYYYVDDAEHVAIRLYNNDGKLAEVFKSTVLNCNTELRHWLRDFHISTNTQGIYELVPKYPNVANASITNVAYFNY